MTTFFPYGATQTLILGSSTVVLEECDYDPDGINIVGYERKRKNDQVVQSDYTLFGVSVLKGRVTEAKFEFDWSLQTTITKAYALQALFMQQQLLARANNSSTGVLLSDTRLAYIEQNPRTRAKVGALITTPAPPSGFSQYYPRFQVLLEEPQIDITIPRLGIAKVRLRANELDFLTTSSDI